MAIIKDRIIHRNLWQVGDLGAVTSEHPQFPAVDLETDTLSQFWRSRYGTDSGNGQFVIDDNNKYLDYDDGGGEENVTITPGTYDGQTLAIEIELQLNSISGYDYIVTYDENTAMFTIEIDGSGTFDILWKTGVHGSDNTDNNVSETIGFDSHFDDIGAGSYTSDLRRIHWPYEEIPRDLLTAYQYNHIALLNHNFSSSAVIKIIGADDAAFTVNVVSDTITYNANNIYFYLTTARTKRYIKIQIADPANSSSYLQLAVPYPGNYWEPSRKRAKGHQQGVEDMSEYEESDSRSFYALEKPKLDTYYFPYPTIDMTSKSNALDLLRTCGLTKAFIVCEDYESPNSYSYYVRNNEELTPTESVHLYFCNWALSVKEVI